MKRILCLITLLLCFSNTYAAVAKSSQRIPKSLRPGLNTLIRHFRNNNHQNLNIGIVVQSMKTGKVLYFYRDQYLFTPASVQKLFPAIAGLTYLKPSYHFKTKLYTTGKVVNGKLTGNVYIKFSGDPELKVKDLNNLIAKLHSKGINKIAGRVYIDNTDYNNIPYPPGWIWDDLSYSYAAPMNAIILNQNKFLLTFVPSKTVGRAPKLESGLPAGVIHFSNHMRTTKRYYKNCPITIYSDADDHFTVRGCLVQKWGEQRRSLAIRNITAFAQKTTQQLFRDNKIFYNKKVLFKKTPKSATLIATHSSPALKKIVKEMLKESDNLMTNAVFKKLGQTYFNTQGTWQNSLHAMKKILSKRTGINFKKALLADGAGLSRYNLLSAKQISKLLYYAYRNKQVRPALITALPIAGHDGTLKYRMRHFKGNKRIHAKTGSMTGVMSLAGYVRSKHHGMVSFVILINGFVKPRRPYVQLEDRICEFLVNAR